MLRAGAARLQSDIVGLDPCFVTARARLRLANRCCHESRAAWLHRLCRVARASCTVRHCVVFERGGPPKDGIPAIDKPRFVAASQARLADDDRVLGVERNGVARAYPVRILNWHEVVNDRFGESAVVVTGARSRRRAQGVPVQCARTPRRCRGNAERHRRRAAPAYSLRPRAPHRRSVRRTGPPLARHAGVLVRVGRVPPAYRGTACAVAPNARDTARYRCSLRLDCAHLQAHRGLDRKPDRLPASGRHVAPFRRLP